MKKLILKWLGLGTLMTRQQCRDLIEHRLQNLSKEEIRETVYEIFKGMTKKDPTSYHWSELEVLISRAVDSHVDSEVKSIIGKEEFIDKIVSRILAKQINP